MMIYEMGRCRCAALAVAACEWLRAHRQRIAARLLLLLLLLHCVAQTESEPYATLGLVNAVAALATPNQHTHTLYPNTKHDNNKPTEKYDILFHFSIAFRNDYTRLRRRRAVGSRSAANSCSYFVVCVVCVCVAGLSADRVRDNDKSLFWYRTLCGACWIVGTRCTYMPMHIHAFHTSSSVCPLNLMNARNYLRRPAAPRTF